MNYQNKKTSFLAKTLASMLLVSACSHAEVTDVTQIDPWFQSGQKVLQKKLQLKENNKPAKNVIIFIGDGMSVATVTAARILDGQLRGESGEENYLSFENFPYSGLSKTYNTDSQTPDSAGTATAMLSGVKTKIGVVGLNDKVISQDCSSTKASMVPTLLELAEEQGFKTGVVSTAKITHATPAAAYAHSASRGWEAQAPAGCEDIASQLVHFDKGDGIEVMLGGGRAGFIPNSMQDFEYSDKKGSRKDNINLIETWKNKNPNGQFVFNQAGFDQAKTQSGKLLGLFEPSHMQYEADRTRTDKGEPSIAEMTSVAIQKLDNKKGFFLLVEGGRIDHAHHASNAYRALHDAIAMADAVKVADELTNDEDTLIIVTADHGHVMEFAGYPERGNPILGKAARTNSKGETQLSLDASGKPYTTLAYLNGPGYTGASDSQPEGTKTYPHRAGAYKSETSRPDLTKINTEDKNYLQESAIPLGSETHSGTDVGVYAKGPSAHLLTGVYEQSFIFHVMQHALRIDKKSE